MDHISVIGHESLTLSARMKCFNCKYVLADDAPRCFECGQVLDRSSIARFRRKKQRVRIALACAMVVLVTMIGVWTSQDARAWALRRCPFGVLNGAIRIGFRSRTVMREFSDRLRNDVEAASSAKPTLIEVVRKESDVECVLWAVQLLATRDVVDPVVESRVQSLLRSTDSRVVTATVASLGDRTGVASLQEEWFGLSHSSQYAVRRQLADYWFWVIEPAPIFDSCGVLDWFCREPDARIQSLLARGLERYSDSYWDDRDLLRFMECATRRGLKVQMWVHHALDRICRSPHQRALVDGFAERLSLPAWDPLTER